MMRPRLPVVVAMAGLCLTLAACRDSEAAKKGPTGTDSTPVALSNKDEVKDVEGGLEGTTPMAERVAVIGLLNKRNGLVRNLEMKPGEAIRVGRAVVRLRACEQAPAWEMPAETGAFVQLLTLERDGKWKRSFSGWLFRERPELNVVQHPIYDVIVKSCAMTTPGGGPAVKPADVDNPDREGLAGVEGAPGSVNPPAKSGSSAPQSPAAKAPAPKAPAAKAPPAKAPAGASPAPKSDDKAAPTESPKAE